jgi:hypothetical protein
MATASVIPKVKTAPSRLASLLPLLLAAKLSAALPAHPILAISRQGVDLAPGALGLSLSLSVSLSLLPSQPRGRLPLRPE